MPLFEITNPLGGLLKGSRHELTLDQGNALVKAGNAVLVTEDAATVDTADKIQTAIAAALVANDIANPRKSATSPAEPKEKRSFKEWLCALGVAGCQEYPHTPDQRKWAGNILRNKYDTEFNYKFEEEFKAGNNDFANKAAAAKGMPGGQVLKASALGETSMGLGGAIVPQEFFPEVFQIIEKKSRLLSKCDQIPMEAPVVTVPAMNYALGGGGNSPYLAGMSAQWGADNTAFVQQNPNFRQIELKANILSGYTAVSRNLLMDTNQALEKILTNLIGETAGFFIDYAIMFGSGSSQPLGVFNSPAAISVTRTAAANGSTLSDVTTMKTKLLRDVDEAEPIWLISPSTEAQFIKMTDAGGRVIFLPNIPGSNAGPAAVNYAQQVLTYPYVVSQIPATSGVAGDMFLIDLKKYYFGIRQQIEIMASDAPGFTSNQIYWRFIFRGDGQPKINTSLTLQNGDVYSPFVYRT